MRILIIDDDSADRIAVRRALGHALPASEISEANAVNAAITSHAGAAMDVVFLDFAMPQLDGLAALGSVLDHWPGAAVVMITGQGDEATASEALKRGAMDYLPKREVSAQTIGTLVTSAVSRNRKQIELDEVRQELETFADRMVHDLQSPIRAIDFYCNEAIALLDGGDEKQARERVRRACRTTERMAALIEALSSYLRVERSSEASEVALADVAKSAIANLAAEIHGSGAQVAIGALPKVSGHEILLVQLLQNLIANALKFRGQSAPRVEITAREDGMLAKVSVADNGIGIPAQILPKIFDPFIRSGTKAGNGLGLATCHRIIAKHRGEIACNSTLGEGTTFTMTLPLATPDPASAPPH
ncbi:ATP-binding protein [Acuticoccus sp. MNP-M23]|uniref:sensor histidine kinase n=1 Tax=Acuticoccus sp. MNP-M23 TaxID=3072793 RepID=UPI002814D634|nr:ATP-binding protein [Acuticoccus sp. MNP-M23]WMS42785.1 ATP-binding protein [Acuticoccus sp. MNP-M23]